MKCIVGEITDEKIYILNNLLKDVITDKRHNPDIYLYYSRKEHTYDNHIKHLIKDIKSKEYNLSEDVCSYELHSDVGKYFTKDIKEVIKDIDIS